MSQRTPGNKSTREPPVHKVTAVPLTTGAPQIGTPRMSQTHHLRAAGAFDQPSRSPGEERARSRTQGHGVAIAQAAGSAAGAGDASAEGATVTAEPPETTAAGGFGTGAFGSGPYGGGPAPLEVDNATSASEIRPDTLVNESEIYPPTITVGTPPRAYRARDVMRSSTWTGRRSVEEQVTVIRSFAPDAMSAAEQLRAAIHERRRNDPDDAEAMRALKELHCAIGELIREAESGPVSAVAWEAYERHREKLAAVAGRGASLTAAAPLAVGLAHFLSWLSGVPVGEAMIVGVYGAVTATDAIRGRAKN